jgi:hypothetical protein
MATFPVETTLVIDPVDLAWTVQEVFAPYLKAEADLGLWLPGRTRPSLVPGKLYYCYDQNGLVQLEAVSASAVKAAKGDIFDETGEMVLPHRVRQQLREEPTLPLKGLEVVRGYVDHTLSQLSRQWSRNSAPRMHEMLQPYIKDEYTELDDLCCAINSHLSELGQQIREFVGTNQWVMHFARWKGTEVWIEKSIDFRIYDWQRRMAAGDWV